MIRPHSAGVTAFEGGELRKFGTGSLNKIRTTYGGGSGYRSESRRTPIGDGKYHFRGILIPAKVVKTIMHYKTKVGEKIESKAISQAGFITTTQAFNMVPFTFKVVYVYGDTTKIGKGESITVTNINIR